MKSSKIFYKFGSNKKKRCTKRAESVYVMVYWLLVGWNSPSLLSISNWDLRVEFDTHTCLQLSLSTAKFVIHVMHHASLYCCLVSFVCLWISYTAPLYTFYQEYGRNLAALGVEAANITAYRSLWQCVAPADRQNLIKF